MLGVIGAVTAAVVSYWAVRAADRLRGTLPAARYQRGR